MSVPPLSWIAIKSFAISVERKRLWLARIAKQQSEVITISMASFPFPLIPCRHFAVTAASHFLGPKPGLSPRER